MCLFAHVSAGVCAIRAVVWTTGWRLEGCKAVWLLEVVIRLIICCFHL